MDIQGIILFAPTAYIYAKQSSKVKKNLNRKKRVTYSCSRGSFKNRFLKSIKPHDLGSILSTSYFSVLL